MFSSFLDWGGSATAEGGYADGMTQRIELEKERRELQADLAPLALLLPGFRLFIQSHYEA